MEKKTDPKIRTAIEHFSEGEFAPDAVEQVHRWLLISKDQEAKKEAWESVWARTESTDEDVTTSLAGVYRRIATQAERGCREQTRRGPVFRRIATAAAAVVLLLLTALVSFRISENQFHRDGVLTSVTAVDSARTVLLPDGSRVRLKRGTTLLYPACFNRQAREVQLIGEAFFDIRKQNGKAFRVYARGTQVVVKGTTFNLKAYSDCNRIEAVLVTGSIDFVTSQQTVPLTPSQKLIYDVQSEHVDVKIVDLAEELKPNLYIFRGGCLRDAAVTIGHIFGCPVRLDTPALGEVEISGTITIDGDNSLRHALEILTLTTGIHYRFDQGEVVIY